MGHWKPVHIVYDFEDNGNNSYPGDLELVIEDPNGNCIRLESSGTQDPLLPYCTNQIPGFTGIGNTDTSVDAILDVSAHGLTGTGTWKVYMAHAFTLPASYDGTLTIIGICTDPGD